MSSEFISNALEQALKAPDGEQSLQRFLEKFHQKHPSLFSVEHGDQDDRLTKMLKQYISLMPVLLGEAEQACRSLGQTEAFYQLASIIDQFFAAIDPQRLDYGIVGILDKVYFGQRLLEELHDRVRLGQGQPFLSWDMAMANLVVHTLIGDAYANRLDMAGMEIIQSLPDLAQSSTGKMAPRQDQAWPCLARRHGLNMVFS